MKITILFFGITTDLVGTSEEEVAIQDAISVADLKLVLLKKHPQLTNLETYAIAVNEVYAVNSLTLTDGDVVAIIPPVSGG